MYKNMSPQHFQNNDFLRALLAKNAAKFCHSVYNICRYVFSHYYILNWDLRHSVHYFTVTETMVILIYGVLAIDWYKIFFAFLENWHKWNTLILIPYENYLSRSLKDNFIEKATVVEFGQIILIGEAFDSKAGWLTHCQRCRQINIEYVTPLTNRESSLFGTKERSLNWNYCGAVFSLFQFTFLHNVSR